MDDLSNQRQNQSRLKWIIVSLTTIVIISLLTLVGYTYTHRLTIYPGVTIAGLPVSNLTKDQAEGTVTEWLTEKENTVINITCDDFQQESTANELGLHPDVNSAVEAAFAVGHDGSWYQNAFESVATLVRGQDISLKDSVDTDNVREIIDQFALLIDREPVDGELLLDGDTVTAIQPQPGRRLDVEPTVPRFLALFDTIPATSVELAVVDNLRPSIDIPQLEAAELRARQLLSASLTTTYGGRNWILTPTRLSDLLAIKKSTANGETSLSVTVDPNLTASYFRSIAEDIDRPAKSATWSFTGAKVIVSTESEEGLTVDIDGAVELAIDGLENNNREMSLPVQKTRPKLTSEDIRGWAIKELSTAASTDYFSGEERMHNIELAATKLDGTIIPQGATFSLNDALGQVSSETGYEQAYVIVDGETVPGMGGGLCQIATTLFQAVFWGGYNIVERYPHDYHMPRYESTHDGVTYKGLDATIATGTDFVFRNNGPSALILKTSTDGKDFHVTLYGTKPSWHVSVSSYTLSNVQPSAHQTIRRIDVSIPAGKEVQVEKATDGFDSRITRIVEEEGETLDEYTVSSSYRATNDVYLSGP